MNIITTVIEIIATLGDLTIVKFEYDGQSALVEKNLKVSHILGLSKDVEFVYENFIPTMGLKEIAHNIRNNIKREKNRKTKKLVDKIEVAPDFSYDPAHAKFITVNDYYECKYCKQRSIFSDRPWVCQNKGCVTNDGSKNLNYVFKPGPPSG